MIRLKKNADRRVRQGHLWVFSNEVAEPPPKSLEPGSIHELIDNAGEFLGLCYANPATLITARILSRKKVKIDHSFFSKRIERALAWRKRLFPDRDFYRVVFGESDGLPGLVVDRYGEFLVLQTSTAGMERQKELITEVLVGLMAPKGIFCRNDSPHRALEGLESEKGVLYGSVPPAVEIDSQGVKLLVDMAEGQKTGFFLDQEWNRPLVRQCLPQSRPRVLDLFSYTGAWGLHALAAGAESVTAVDSSRGALKIAGENAALNGVADRFHTVREPVLDFLKKNREEWDLIIMDPPAFIKSQSGLAQGKRAYIDLNRRALGKLAPGGVIITCSCSHHLRPDDFERVLASAARQSGKDLKVLEYRGQGPDHPVLLSMPETRYLKVLAARVD